MQRHSLFQSVQHKKQCRDKGGYQERIKAVGLDTARADVVPDGIHRSLKRAKMLYSIAEG